MQPTLPTYNMFSAQSSYYRLELEVGNIRSADHEHELLWHNKYIQNRLKADIQALYAHTPGQQIASVVEIKLVMHFVVLDIIGLFGLEQKLVYVFKTCH